MSDGMWHEQRMVWFRGPTVSVNVKWVVGLWLAPVTDHFEMKVKTIDGTVWTLTEGSKEEMTRLMGELIR